jgi:hypothetical protein
VIFCAGCRLPCAVLRCKATLPCVV